MKLKPALGASYTIWPRNRVILIYGPAPIWGTCVKYFSPKTFVLHIET